VLLNDGATLIATCEATRDIACGEEVTGDDLEASSDLRPFGIDPAAVWVGFASIPGHGSTSSPPRHTRNGPSTWIRTAAPPPAT
jgi:hypothetical protein